MRGLQAEVAEVLDDALVVKMLPTSVPIEPHPHAGESARAGLDIRGAAVGGAPRSSGVPEKERIPDCVRLRGEEARGEDIRAQAAGTTRSSSVLPPPGIGAREETRLLDDDNGETRAAAPISKRERAAQYPGYRGTA